MRERTKDGWSYLVPLTTKELADARAKVVAHYRDAGEHSIADELEPPDSFTCDHCGAAPTCTLAFDAMNTARDDYCLMDK